jgi:hypothetical protein
MRKQTTVTLEETPIATEVLPVEASSPVEDIYTEEYIYDEVADKYVKAKVPVSAQIISEPNDAFDVDPLALGSEWDNGRGVEMNGVWVNINANHQSSARQKGYAPVRPEDFKSRRYQRRKVDGCGESIVCGDLVLMEMPKKVSEAKYERALETKHAEMQEMLHGVRPELENAVGMYGDNSGVQNNSQYSVAEKGYEDRSDVNAYADAEAEAEMQAYSGSSSRRQFGGFQGSSAYNKWNPSGPRQNYGYRP